MNWASCDVDLSAVEAFRTRGCDDGQCQLLRKLQNRYPYSRRYAYVTEALESLGFDTDLDRRRERMMQALRARITAREAAKNVTSKQAL